MLQYLFILAAALGVGVLGAFYTIKRIKYLQAIAEEFTEDVIESRKIDGVNADLNDLDNLIQSGKTTQEIYAACKKYEHLNKVEGFAAVITLFKHRHRKRALARLEVFCREWVENGLKLYDRI